MRLADLQSDTVDGGKRKGDSIRRARLFVPNILLLAEGNLGRIIKVTFWFTVVQQRDEM